MRRSSVLLFASTLLAACGSDSPTGPSDAQIAGVWRITWSNLTGSLEGTGVSCAWLANFNITQTGTTFSGVQTATGTLTCTAQGEGVVLSEQIDAETIVSGTIDGNSVTFRLGSIPSNHTGTVSGTSMSGMASWTFQDLDFVLQLQGNWTAAKL